MGKLIYLLNVSLDGFVETPDHSLAWANVDDELHTWFNDQMRDVAASLYGRRLYEVMSAYWPNYESDPDATEPMREFGRIWNADAKDRLLVDARPVDFNSRLVRGDVGDGARAGADRIRRRHGSWRCHTRGVVHPARPRRRIPPRSSIP